MTGVYQAAISNDEAKELIDLCCWDRLFTITVGNGDKKIMEGLIERWWDTTHTFHFLKLEIGFTPLDFTFLTGISIGSGDPPPFNLEAFADYESMMYTYFLHMTPHISENKHQYRGNGINPTYVKEYILQSQARDTTEEGEEIARAFFMWMIGQVFFANSTCVVPIGWLAALLVIEDVGTYDWGSSILARIYRSLDECSRCAPYFSGMWMILEERECQSGQLENVPSFRERKRRSGVWNGMRNATLIPWFRLLK
ncbi:Aminotransferase-like [Macleaya cordata]|uniref:Aminotransferase-like n=1 Tax=Macleaya cordata TaxID=56857 RepID=A0A200QNW4_MACCD|nr:Aminotransferase-like [Macleaya cordata]